MNDPQNHFTDEELEKLRKEVLEWIEKNERLNYPRAARAQKKSTGPRISAKIALKQKRLKIFSLPKIPSVKKDNQIQERMAKFFNSFFSGKFMAQKHEISFSKKITLFILIIFSALQIYAILGLYFFGWNNFFIRFNASFFFYPAAKIKNSPVLYKSFSIHEKKLPRYIPLARWADENKSLDDNILKYLWLEKKLKENNFSVNKLMIETGLNSRFYHSLSREGLTPEDFKKYVIVPDIILDKIYNKIKQGDPEWRRALQKADEIIEKLDQYESSANYYRIGDLPYEFQTTLSEIQSGQGEHFIAETNNGVFVLQLQDQLLELGLAKLVIVTLDKDFSKKRILESYYLKDNPKLFLSNFR